MINNVIKPRDQMILRRLAGQVAELAARDVEAKKIQLWTVHNDLGATRPLVFCDPENGWNEIITSDQMECIGDLSRQWEYHLRKEIFWGESIRDDRVIEPWFNIAYIHARSGWGCNESYVKHEAQGSYAWDPPVKDLNDLTALRFPEISIDYQATEMMLGLATEVFGDLLPSRLRGSWYWTLGLTWEFIKLHGLEAMMMDMLQNPGGTHALMAFLRDGTMSMIDALERDGLFTLNNEGDYVGSGGFGWTSQLPAPGYDGHVRTRDLWCLSESQETVSISPQLFEEFVFPYQLPVVERFGLVCYGCCEPVHSRWHVIRRITNLRRVSVSPWCDRARMAEFLSRDYVYSLKPHPALLAQSFFDEEAIRADARDALEKAAGCHLEIIMKDNHTIGNDPRRVIRWVEIVREEIDRRG